MTPRFILLLLVLFLLGLVVGSFLNVCIHRWPRDESVIRPRSHCPECETTLGWADLIPLISYLVLKARCRHCSARIPLRYPIVELSNGLKTGILSSLSTHSPPMYILIDDTSPD